TSPSSKSMPSPLRSCTAMSPLQAPGRPTTRRPASALIEGVTGRRTGQIDDGTRRRGGLDGRDGRAGVADARRRDVGALAAIRAGHAFAAVDLDAAIADHRRAGRAQIAGVAGERRLLIEAGLAGRAWIAGAAVDVFTGAALVRRRHVDARLAHRTTAALAKTPVDVFTGVALVRRLDVDALLAHRTGDALTPRDIRARTVDHRPAVRAVTTGVPGGRRRHVEAGDAFGARIADAAVDVLAGGAVAHRAGDAFAPGRRAVDLAGGQLGAGLAAAAAVRRAREVRLA